MKAYWFRIVDEDGKPTGHVGLAIAPDMTELFWQIDEHYDPFACEIKKAKFGSFCVRQKVTDYGEDEIEVENLDLELSEHTPQFDEDIGWKKYDWTKHDIYGRHLIEVELEK